MTKVNAWQVAPWDDGGMKNLETSAGRLAWREAGEGPPLVLLHAAGHDHHDYDAVFEALAATHHVYALDWPGHGASGLAPLPGDTTVLLVAAALEEWAAAVLPGPAVFLGNSVGGFAAVCLALSQARRVRALVLVDSGGFTDTGVVARLFCGARGTPWLNRLTWNVFPALYLRRRNPHVHAILERLRAQRSPSSVAVNAALWRSFLLPQHDLRTRAAAVAAPTLLVWGRQDPVIALRSGELAARTIPGAQLAVLPCGHMPFAEDPDAFLNVVKPFLAANA